MSRVPLIILLIICAGTASFAQSKKKQKKTKSSQQQSTSLSPYFPSEDYEPEKKGKNKSRKVTYNAMDEHEDRMKAVVKGHRKAEKERMKPQYADPTYFGHKRKPKKSKPGKMKFCKECEIRHWLPISRFIVT